MSDFVRHECGLALVRLPRPLSYYQQRFGDAAWGLRQLYLLMEKQHNRGQDGAGLAMVKFDMPPGEAYLRRVRTDKHNALEHVFDTVMRDVKQTSKRQNAETPKLKGAAGFQQHYGEWNVECRMSNTECRRGDLRCASIERQKNKNTEQGTRNYER